MNKPIRYRIVLLVNGEYRATLYRCKTRVSAFKKFIHMKNENEKILFPKRFINYNKIIPVKYEIYCVKDVEDSDESRLVKDLLGKISFEEPLFDIWTILDSAPYEVEETFWIYGKDPKKDRSDIREVVKLLMKGANDRRNIKQVIVINNKLVIHNENQFDMVITKCKEDAQRLHHTLFQAVNKHKIRNVLFMGTVSEASKGIIYDLIKEKTNWPMRKIHRKTTRP